MSSPAPTASTSKFPSGMVMGPDGKPCKVCTGFKAWSGATKKKVPGAAAPVAAAAAAAVAATASTAFATDSPPKDCPADVERLGRHTWTFLHSTAAYYPLAPTPLQKSSMLSLLTSLPHLYPCSHCAGELGEYMKLHPPALAVEKREDLEGWMCRAHNDVSERLGKDKFDCDLVGERWRDGWKDGRCD